MRMWCWQVAFSVLLSIGIGIDRYSRHLIDRNWHWHLQATLLILLWMDYWRWAKKYNLANIQEILDEWLKSMGGQNAKWRKLSRQNSISIAETFTDKMQNSPPARKTVNKKWSSFSFLLQTEPDEKPNKGINSRRTFLIPFLISNFHCLISVSLNYFFVPSAIVSLNFVLNLCILIVCFFLITNSSKIKIINSL